MRSLIDESLCHFPLAAAYSLFTPFRIPFCVLIERMLKLMRTTGLQRLKVCEQVSHAHCHCHCSYTAMNGSESVPLKAIKI
jgi:hypothetical protein